MTSAAEQAYEINKALVGTEEGVGDWFEITQERVNAFADATLDHQFIHVDPERAKATPFGGPIAHGFLSLSLLVHLDTSIKKAPERFAGVVMGVNYGLDKVRFISPVPVGSRVRARSVISEVTLKDANTVQTKRTMTVEIDGTTKPALVAEWITLTVFA
jgi:acyl dehydratase